MSKYSILENPTHESWNSVLESQHDGNFWQTIDYGEISESAFPHTKTARLLAVDNGKPVGIVQGIYSKYFGFGTCLLVREGPIINANGDERLDLLEEFLNALEDFGVRNRIISTEVWWPNIWGGCEIFNDLGYASEGGSNVYTVNLNRTVDDLWNSIDRNKRKNIRKALSKGVEVFETSNYEDVPKFYSLLTSSAKRQNFVAPPLSWFEAIWKLRGQRELTKVFIARWNGKDVAGVFISIHAKTIYALAAGSLSEGLEARPNDILHWKAMEWGCQQGFSKYYMGLVSEPVPKEGSGSWNLWRWKREWNGDLETLRFFDKFYMPRYKYVLGAKKLIERSYMSLKKLRI